MDDAEACGRYRIDRPRSKLQAANEAPARDAEHRVRGRHSQVAPEHLLQSVRHLGRPRLAGAQSRSNRETELVNRRAERKPRTGGMDASIRLSLVRSGVQKTPQMRVIPRRSPENAATAGLAGGAQSFRTLMYGPSPMRKVAALIACIRLRSCIRPLDGAPRCTPGHDGNPRTFS
jgi:hypothetical protein